MNAKLTLSIWAATVGMVSLTQPIFTSTDGQLNIGDAVRYHSTNWSTAGPSGVGVLWDFSTLPDLGPAIDTVVNPATTPYGSYYLNATEAQGTYLGFGYFIQSATEMQNLGSANETTYISLLDPWMRRMYPFTYDDAWSDSFSGAGAGTNGNFTWAGTSADTVDGWGTLILPSGTLTDVLRLHATAEYDEVDPAPIDTVTHNWETYEWYIPGIKKPLLYFHRNIAMHNGSVVTDAMVAGWLDTIVNIGTSLAANAENHDPLLIAPNPAMDLVHIQFTGSAEISAPLELRDAVGRQIPISVSRVSIGNGCITRIELPVADLVPGAYLVTLQGEQWQAHARFIKE